MSVSALARAADVAKSTVSQLERHSGNPSLDTLWALARALNIPLGFLFDEAGTGNGFRVLRAAESAAVPTIEEPNYTARLMAGWQMNGEVEIYLVDYANDVRRDSEPHGNGVTEHFLAMEGRIEVGTAHDSVVLEPGDMVSFAADRPHHYQVIGGPARAISVQQYPAALSPSQAPVDARDRRRELVSTPSPSTGLRSRLLAGEVALGTMLFEFNTFGVPRILADAGADFVMIDLEHTGWGVPQIRPLLATARSEPIVPIVRVQGAARHLVSAVLDAGAAGVMVPMVADAAEAERVVAAARFSPDGDRGFGLVYPDQVANGVQAATEAAEAETIVILLIETMEGLENVEKIAAVQGVDVLWVGEYDLSMSMGIPGALEDPRLKAAEDRVVAACGRAGITPGILVGDVATATSMRDRGFRMIALGTDINLYSRVVSSDLAQIRNGESSARA
jgi:2-keto-3-deoxy-L-rhamnonate aldolase RhmA/transcriptional regulator with XRE-family HTH domain